MKKWSYQIFLTIIAACCCFFTPAIGQDDCYDSCCPDSYDSFCPGKCSCGDYAVDVGFLWWKPCVDHLDFAHCLDLSSLWQEHPIAKVKHRTICPDWETGVRVQAMASNLNCGMGLGASWTYIGPKESSSATGKPICISLGPVGSLSGIQELLQNGNGNGKKFVFSPWTQLGVLPFEKIHASWEACYHDWDVLLFYPCCVCGNSQVWTPYFGLASLALNQEVKGLAKGDIICDEYFTLGRELKTKWTSDLNAYGLRVGMKYEWDFCDCFKIFGKADASVLAGSPCDKLTRHVTIFKEVPIQADAYSKNGSEEFDVKAIFKDDDCYRCYPGYRLGVGVTYEKCVCNTDFSLSIGYEFVEWRNIPNQRLPLETVDPVLSLVFDFEDSNGFDLYPDGFAVGASIPSLNTTSPSDRTLGFHGLVLEVGASF